MAAHGEALTAAARRTLKAEGESLTGRSRRLATMPDRQLAGEDRRLDQWRRLLGAYDYQRQLERGYSVTRDELGRVVRSVDGVEVGALLRTRVADGELVSTVEETGAAPPNPPRHPLGDNHNEEGMT